MKQDTTRITLSLDIISDNYATAEHIRHH